jgi:Flp pilus assembly protein TadG
MDVQTKTGLPMRASMKRKIKRRGTAVVEAALVLPVCLMFLFGIMEYGRYIMMQQVLTNAAREGCRYAVTHVNSVTIAGVTTSNTTASVTNIINSALAGQTLSSQNTQIFCSDSLGNNLGTWTNTQSGQSICVQITGNYLPLISKYLYMSASIPVQVQSVMRAEGT